MHFKVRKSIFSQLSNFQEMSQGIFIMTETYSNILQSLVIQFASPLGCGIYFLILGIFGVMETTFRAFTLRAFPIRATRLSSLGVV